MPNPTHPVEIFKKYVPELAVLYCFELWKKYDFHLNIKKKRNSKLGDYRFDFQTKLHTITVNADLNPYSFLITYLHEVAHLITQITYGNRAEPHGIEWKNEFKKIALPMVNDQIFPPDLLLTIQKYFKNPKASSCADPQLMKQLHVYNKNNNDSTILDDVSIGKSFELSGRIFIKESTQRTRVMCRELSTGKKYLISKAAFVNIKLVA
jgi:predicted SprT family Zn-dependent metalloprotease